MIAAEMRRFWSGLPIGVLFAVLVAVALLAPVVVREPDATIQISSVRKVGHLEAGAVAR